MYIVHNEDLSKKAYEALKIMILDGRLKPGAKLYQEKLAEDLGISRTPLNGALNQLEKEMLLVSLPRRGFYVTELSVKELIKLYDIRKKLDPLCAAEASQNTDQELKKQCMVLIDQFAESYPLNKFIRLLYNFYSLIISMNENNFLKNMMTSYNLISLVNLQLHLKNETISDNYMMQKENYINILNAVYNGNRVDAEKAMQVHIDNIYSILLNSVELKL